MSLMGLHHSQNVIKIRIKIKIKSNRNQRSYTEMTSSNSSNVHEYSTQQTSINKGILECSGADVTGKASFM